MNLRYGLAPGGGSVSKRLLWISVKCYVLMSHAFKNILIVSCFPGDLEGKVKWPDNHQKCRHLHEIIVWPPLWDGDQRLFIPEVQKGSVRAPGPPQEFGT